MARMLKTFLHHNYDEIVSFIGGDIAVMIAVYLRFGGIFSFMEHCFIVGSYGVIGGFCGLAGKEIWHWFKGKYLKK